jgi:hypothetical protein
LFVGFVILAPMIHSILAENLLFALFAIGTVAVILAALWNSMQTVNSKLCEAFEGRTASPGTPELPSDVKEVIEAIEAMEGTNR